MFERASDFFYALASVFFVGLASICSKRDFAVLEER